MRPVFVGVDVGTGSARAGVFDQAGTLLGASAFEIAIRRPGAHFVEQDSEDIWRAVGKAVQASLAEAGAAPDEVRGIAFDATCSLVVRDQELRPLGVSPGGPSNWDVIVWMDHRARHEAETCTRTGADVLDYIGGVMSPEMETPKLMWLKRHHPAAWATMGKAFDLADFLAWRATGVDQRSTCTLTCKWAYLAHEARPWREDYLRAIGLEDLNAKTGAADNVVKVGVPVGPLTPAAADELGLTTRCVVGAGLIDAHAGALGTLGPHLDCSMDHRVAMIAGTSTCLMGLSREPHFIEGVWGPYFGGVVDGWWMNEGGQSISGALLEFVLRLHPAARDLGKDAHRYLAERILAHYPEGGDLAPRLHVLPDFHGNRSPLADPNALGVISGLTTDLREETLVLLYWATACAIAYGARHILDHMNARGFAIDTIHLSGGHAASMLLRRLYADATGCEVVLSSCQEPVLLGSAMVAATAAGAHGSLAEAGEVMGGQETVTPPDPAVHELHARRYQAFLRLHEHRRELDRIAGC